MNTQFPELTTIGALFRFAGKLEETAVEVLQAAADKNADQADDLRRLAKKHGRRADEVDRARREKLNETVLEPLMDMPNTPYVPALPEDLSAADGPALLAAAKDLETRAVAFYGDAVDKAGPVLAEVKRLFARLQRESEKNLKAL